MSHFWSGARLSKAPETFRERKAIFSLSVFKSAPRFYGRVSRQQRMHSFTFVQPFAQSLVIYIFTITAKILAHSLANFYCQYVNLLPLQHTNDAVI